MRALTMPLTKEEVEAAVEDIRKIAGDDEAAHGDEDELHCAVMQAIADGTWRDSPAALCRAALKTKEIDFARWCA